MHIDRVDGYDLSVEIGILDSSKQHVNVLWG